MNANTRPSYLFNVLRSGATPLGQSGLGMSRHSINEISWRTGQTPRTSLGLNHEGPGADSHSHPTPSTITDIEVKGVEVEGREASSHYLPDILQTGDGDPVFGQAASSRDRIPFQQERHAHETEIGWGLASLRSNSSPTVVESAPFPQPETERPAATEKGLSEVEHLHRQSGRRVFRVIEEDQVIARKEVGTAPLRTEAYRPGMSEETLPPGAPISPIENVAPAGQSSYGESHFPARPAASA